MTGAEEEEPSPLLEVLADARQAGYLGPGPLDVQVRHGQGFAVVGQELWRSASVANPRLPAAPTIVDLGSGGGVPGLVVAEAWPEAHLVLLEASGRRAAFLRRAVERLGLGSRVEVVQDRAEQVGREAMRRGSFDGALARSFGKPAVVAECAAPLLRPGSWLVVSEPPGAARIDAPDATEPARGEGRPDASRVPPGSGRWPPEGLRVLGLEPLGLVRSEFVYQTLRQSSPCPDRFPRRDGVPAKKPLF